MMAEGKQTNHGNQKIVLQKSKTKTSAQKTKAGISNSLLKRIISLLKKEELI
ncbi:hypothetical protein M9991_02520 [Chryseobacterium gallinarum]|uniref:hypothetical protein n=1 Tax=Chryseobacterium gallinarum TaxID=1324352 RepID=UPI002024917D|nr:hypothetical protein [Chryseobacterium gallinarum]MCL8535730.1 hypothetical protein [Chryseobacterium gallinarum]